MRLSTGVVTAAVVAALTGIASAPAAQATTIANGGFESGFAGWTRVDQAGSGGSFYSQTGTASPVNGDPVPAPPQGSLAAMTDGDAPGSHVMYQDFLVTAGTTSLSFQLFIGNRADRFATPATLDFATPVLNQQARVDIMIIAADPFSLAVGDILQNVYQTQVGDALISGYTTITLDVSALLAAYVGSTLRLRFAETDNVGPFQMGIDDVRFEGGGGTVPEPASTLLLGAGMVALLARRRGRQRARA